MSATRPPPVGAIDEAGAAVIQAHGQLLQRVEHDERLAVTRPFSRRGDTPGEVLRRRELDEETGRELLPDPLLRLVPPLDLAQRIERARVPRTEGRCDLGATELD